MTEFEQKLKNLIIKLEEIPVLADIVADQEMEKHFPAKVKHQIKEEGENEKGEIIQFGYGKFWGEVRSIAGLQIEYVDLYYTGKFLDNLTTVKSGEEYFLSSPVPYLDDLKSRYSGILGLQDENFSIILDEIRKNLIKEIKDGR